MIPALKIRAHSDRSDPSTLAVFLRTLKPGKWTSVVSLVMPFKPGLSPNNVPSLEKRASLRIQAAAVPTTSEYQEAHDHVDRLFSTTYLLGDGHATGNRGLPRRAGGHGYGAVAAPAAR